MAIDKNQTKELLSQIDALFNAEMAGVPLSPAVIQWAREQIFGEALGELRRMIDEARPPVFYLLGRAQHGKSSLINNVLGGHVADVGGVGQACTRDAIRYDITFLKRHASCVMIDSRGIFEAAPPSQTGPSRLVPPPPNDEVVVQMDAIPGGTSKDSAEDIAIQQICQCKPDIVFHVVAITEVANLAKDIEVMRRIQEKTKGTPVVVVLTKADNLGRRREWPPEQFPDKRKAIADHVESMAKHGFGKQQGRHAPIDSNNLYRGCHVEGDSPFLNVIPVNVPTDATGNPVLDDQWNLDFLLDVVGGQLPRAARLMYFQAAKRKAMLQEMSDSLIRKFAGIAGGVALIPTFGVGDVFVLTPMQMVMIAAIGGLSCRPASKDTALDYLKVAGVNLAGGVILRSLAGFLASLFPVGLPIKAGIAASATYGIGKSAEAYFFGNEVKSPQSFQVSYKPAPAQTSP